MTKHECAIVTAHTGITMLRGDDLKYLYHYLSEIIGRPVFSHEIPAVCEQFRDQIKADFIALCRNASDDIVCDDESKTALAKMPEVRLIDANAAADKIMREIETHADETGIGAAAILIAFARALRDETDFPTIEPEVRHGRWKKKNGEIYCTNCKKCKWSESFELMLRRFNFCPNCGARMDGGTDDAGHCGR